MEMWIAHIEHISYFDDIVTNILEGKIIAFTEGGRSRNSFSEDFFVIHLFI